MDKVPHRYWDDMWLTDALPTPLDFSPGIRVKPVSRHIRDFVAAHIEHLGPAPAVVEVGCGGGGLVRRFFPVPRRVGAGGHYPPLGRVLGGPGLWSAARHGVGPLFRLCP